MTAVGSAGPSCTAAGAAAAGAVAVGAVAVGAPEPGRFPRVEFAVDAAVAELLVLDAEPADVVGPSWRRPSSLECRERRRPRSSWSTSVGGGAGASRRVSGTLWSTKLLSSTASSTWVCGPAGGRGGRGGRASIASNRSYAFALVCPSTMWCGAQERRQGTRRSCRSRRQAAADERRTAKRVRFASKSRFHHTPSNCHRSHQIEETFQSPLLHRSRSDLTFAPLRLAASSS
jgi:hypothetical protein